MRAAFFFAGLCESRTHDTPKRRVARIASGNSQVVDFTNRATHCRLSIMSENKKTVEKYMDAFSKSDHAGVLACLTDDVEWILPGVYHRVGKEEFDHEIENNGGGFVGTPNVTVTRLVEENDVVVAEGKVEQKKEDGGMFRLEFCDVFEMQDAKIKKLVSYLAILDK